MSLDMHTEGLNPRIPVFSRSLGSWVLSIDRKPFAPEDLATHYNASSRTWHNLVHRLGFESAYRQLIERVLQQPRYAQNANTLRVLDAGIGTGAMSHALCSAVKQRIQLDGIDISDDMLRQAAKHLRGRDVDLTLTRADIRNPPFADNCFDVVLASHVLEHLPEPQQALAEITRVLKPGGVLICSITRTSWTGAYIQTIWRTHCVSPAVARGWLKAGGLHSVRAVPFGKANTARRFSLGYVGRKPAY